MAFSVTVHHLLLYLLVEAAGQASFSDLLALADMGAALNAPTPSRRALVNALELETSLTFREQLELGAHLARRLMGYRRVAMVTASPVRAGTIETAAKQLGLVQLRIFGDVDTATRWVEEPYAPDPT